MLYWGPSPCLFLSSGDSFPGLWQNTHMLSSPIHLKVSCKHQDTHIYTYAHTYIYILTHTHEAGVSGSQGWVINQSGPKHPRSPLTLFNPRETGPCLHVFCPMSSKQKISVSRCREGLWIVLLLILETEPASGQEKVLSAGVRRKARQPFLSESKNATDSYITMCCFPEVHTSILLLLFMLQFVLLELLKN